MAALWISLAADRNRLRVTGGQRWLEDNADAKEMAERYESLLKRATGD